MGTAKACTVFAQRFQTAVVPLAEICSSTWGSASQATPVNAMSNNYDNLGWWREARFGLFIHFGLYAIPAGVWKEREIPGIGEQILRKAEIPVAEYAQLAGQFNPVHFDADAKEYAVSTFHCCMYLGDLFGTGIGSFLNYIMAVHT